MRQLRFSEPLRVDLLETLADDFPRKTRLMGEDYFRRHTVQIISNNHQSVTAKVRGTRLYDVTIEFDDPAYDCSCPYFSEHMQPCKHIWATLLAASAKGILPREAVGEEDDWDVDLDEHAMIRLAAPREKSAPVRHAVWRRRLQEVRDVVYWRSNNQPMAWPGDREIAYIVELNDSLENHGLLISLQSRIIAPGVPASKRYRRLRLATALLPALPDPADRQIITTLFGIAAPEPELNTNPEVPYEATLAAPLAAEALHLMCRTGRCRIRQDPDQEDPPLLTWDERGPWEFCLGIVPDPEQQTYRVQGRLQRGEQRLDIADSDLTMVEDIVFSGQTAAPLLGGGAIVQTLARAPQIAAPMEQGDELLQELLNFPDSPQLELPPSMQISEVRAQPRIMLKLSPPSKSPADKGRVPARLSFDYNGEVVFLGAPGAAVFRREQRQVVYRDLVAEQRAAVRLRELGLRQTGRDENDPSIFTLPAPRLPQVVRTLLTEKWHVELRGKNYRQPGAMRLEVASGIDWFELTGKIDFEGKSVSLPELLKTVSRGEPTIVLDDGSVGLIPEQWLRRYGLLAAMGEMNGDTVQFAKAQAGLLDALLAEMPEVTVDETFAKARDALKQFSGVQAADPPPTFIGALRPYQREGLGWLHFLRNFGLNGCLADDMGLGKTVQVLALLEERRLLRQGGEIKAPSVVVVPRSLVFNWQQEAARFAPQLRLLDHATATRLRSTEHFNDYDVVLTTYGTLRNDAAAWRDICFDYAILDEAQAIKNAASESAKAARMLRASHRLALSGTPVQNHLGELWSLFEFLNPGMMGASRTMAALTGAAGRAVDPATRDLLAEALRPFILRRTKEQVAQDLPEKLEQTLFCELDETQRALYDELKQHYRQALLEKIDQDGLGKSKLQVLEALLRLRQAACHPGLLDKSRADEPSAKLDALLPQLTEVAEEGHKALVFSQFTSLLALVRKRLDDQGITYEYLDGKTRDRQERVDRFQNEPDCKLFLISLKAGGLGLNLTAAQYVFLLDPWWNPAVEAQAIDRAHRIGQKNKVFAYRLIARDTVEEKVLQLQQAKRDLADAIINADNALIAKLGREDLELLLS